MSSPSPARSLRPTASRGLVSVNGKVIAADAIRREARNHPQLPPAEAWRAAAAALVVKELLVQEACRLGVTGSPESDGEGCSETEEEAAIRTLVEREVRVPDADEAECRRYYEANRRRFRSADLYEASHILLAASPCDPDARREAEALATRLAAQLVVEPARFAELARDHSQCPSSAQGGSLGQLSPGSTVPEFESALAAMTPGTVAPRPVETRYGFHVVRLERRLEGRELPFEMVHPRIAGYLARAASHRAHAQYVARLVSAADIRGIVLAGADDHRVH